MLSTEKNKSVKNKWIWRSFIFIFSFLVLLFIWKHFTSDYINKKTSISKEEIEKTTIAKAPESKINVLTLGEIPFKDNKNIDFHSSDLNEIKKLDTPEIVLVNKEYLKDKYKSEFKKFIKKEHTILFYDDRITADEVVLFLDGIVPVVPLESTIPLKFQAYGVTTLNDKPIPIFISSTVNEEKAKVESFNELFIQINEKTKSETK
ncbi:hypothetical protein MZM54_04775 [[Brevibacterium] frigoritolerans]|nr:hypothetical protein [Peribacillus frigoritolerans]